MKNDGANWLGNMPKFIEAVSPLLEKGCTKRDVMKSLNLSPTHSTMLLKIGVTQGLIHRSGSGNRIFYCFDWEVGEKLVQAEDAARKVQAAVRRKNLVRKRAELLEAPFVPKPRTFAPIVGFVQLGIGRYLDSSVGGLL